MIFVGAGLASARLWGQIFLNKWSNSGRTQGPPLLNMENNVKKNIVLVLAVVFIVGCGSNKKETQKSSQQDASAKSQQYAAQAMQYLRDKDVAKAIRSFDMAIKSDPSNPEEYILLGQVYLRLKSPSRAIDTLRAALHVAPNNPEIYYMLATSLGLRWKEGDQDKAIEAAKKSVEFFMQRQDQDKFKKAVALLKGLTEKVRQK